MLRSKAWGQEQSTILKPWLLSAISALAPFSVYFFLSKLELVEPPM